MAAPLLASATIGKTHGVNGFVRVYSLSGEIAHIKKLKNCIVRTPAGEELSLSVDAVEEKDDYLLMRFSGYSTLEKARFLVKSVILIPRENAVKLKKGEYYVADLYGMDVIYDKRKVGIVEYTMEGAQSLLLSVKRLDNSREYLVPNLPVYVRNICVEDNSLELIYPELMEL